MSPQTFPQFGYWGHFGQKSPLENWTIRRSLSLEKIDNIWERDATSICLKMLRYLPGKKMIWAHLKWICNWSSSYENKMCPRPGRQKCSACRKVLSNWRGGGWGRGVLRWGTKCRERPKMPGAAELTSHQQLFSRHTAPEGPAEKQLTVTRQTVNSK